MGVVVETADYLNTPARALGAADAVGWTHENASSSPFRATPNELLWLTSSGVIVWGGSKQQAAALAR